MTMFDNRLHKQISMFGDEYMSTERNVRNYMSFGYVDGTDDTLALSVKANGRSKEILRMTREEYNSSIQNPIKASRCSSTIGQRFFGWHLLGEKNLQQTFLNTVKELQNA